MTLWVNKSTGRQGLYMPDVSGLSGISGCLLSAIYIRQLLSDLF
jgi:hypothetical protein